jgi:aspartyl aminopeptidase
MQVKITKPIMRIPMLAIHLYREIGEQGFKPNKQNHVVPVLATAVKAAANGGADAKIPESAEPSAQSNGAEHKDAGDADGVKVSTQPSNSFS